MYHLVNCDRFQGQKNWIGKKLRDFGKNLCASFSSSLGIMVIRKDEGSGMPTITQIHMYSSMYYSKKIN